ncbi:YrhK family protein [Dietzia sp. PP-33]|jgi:hypothetical protein|uniref:YrhK family protein n=1 Tax=Dietzia sp. PP-33 TaxID=2957500 RepID=UPI0029A5FFA2|nr:YrhK family protein [Dietzia sp. PP-33]MDX2357812.1 YrhK family protein [Dietzia sp. PP-33]
MSTTTRDGTGTASPLRLAVGPTEVVINDRYETLSIVNDVLIALFFLVGSIFFFSEDTQTIGTWLFLLGSLEFLARPAIRLARRIHLRRLGSDTHTEQSSYDY